MSNLIIKFSILFSSFSFFHTLSSAQINPKLWESQLPQHILGLDGKAFDDKGIYKFFLHRERGDPYEIPLLRERWKQASGIGKAASSTKVTVVDRQKIFLDWIKSSTDNIYYTEMGNPTGPNFINTEDDTNIALAFFQTHIEKVNMKRRDIEEVQRNERTDMFAAQQNIKNLDDVRGDGTMTTEWFKQGRDLIPTYQFTNLANPIQIRPLNNLNLDKDLDNINVNIEAVIQLLTTLQTTLSDAIRSVDDTTSTGIVTNRFRIFLPKIKELLNSWEEIQTSNSNYGNNSVTQTLVDNTKSFLMQKILTKDNVEQIQQELAAIDTDINGKTLGDGTLALALKNNMNKAKLHIEPLLMMKKQLERKMMIEMDKKLEGKRIETSGTETGSESSGTISADLLTSSSEDEHTGTNRCHKIKSILDDEKVQEEVLKALKDWSTSKEEELKKINAYVRPYQIDKKMYVSVKNDYISTISNCSDSDDLNYDVFIGKLIEKCYGTGKLTENQKNELTDKIMEAILKQGLGEYQPRKGGLFV